jgi:hypothetical protein
MLSAEARIEEEGARQCGHLEGAHCRTDTPVLSSFMALLLTFAGSDIATVDAVTRVAVRMKSAKLFTPSVYFLTYSL